MEDHASWVLLDRDGVISEDHGTYVRSWAQFSFLPGALEALAMLTRAGYRLVVVTNQSVVGRGLISRGDLDAIHMHMRREVSRAGGHLEEVLVCPHRPEEGCSCRKPKPGLILEAVSRFGLSSGSTYLVGDHLDDMAAAVAAGCIPVLVATGRGIDCWDEVQRRFPKQVSYFPHLWAVARRLVENPAGLEAARAGF